MLTAKQENFVKLLNQGTSQTSACKGAYDTQNMSDKTVWEEASRLRRHHKVSTRIQSQRRKRRLEDAYKRSLEKRESLMNQREQPLVMGLWRASLKQWNYLVNTLGFSLPKKKVRLKEPQERYLVKFTLDFRKFFHSKSVFTYILMSLKPIQIYLLFPRNRSDMSCVFCLVFLIILFLKSKKCPKVINTLQQ